jgi:hypothetical protein
VPGCPRPRLGKGRRAAPGTDLHSLTQACDCAAAAAPRAALRPQGCGRRGRAGRGRHRAGHTSARSHPGGAPQPGATTRTDHGGVSKLAGPATLRAALQRAPAPPGGGRARGVQAAGRGGPGARGGPQASRGSGRFPSDALRRAGGPRSRPNGRDAIPPPRPPAARPPPRRSRATMLAARRGGVASSSARVQHRRPAATARLVVRAVAEPATRPAAERNGAAAKASSNGAAKAPTHFINVIPQTAWEKGIPPVMVRRAGAGAAGAAAETDAAAARRAAAAAAHACPAGLRPRGARGGACAPVGCAVAARGGGAAAARPVAAPRAARVAGAARCCRRALLPPPATP